MILNGRTALVTGAGRGIGAAIAQRLASEGAHVYCADKDLETATSQSVSIGGTAIKLDVTQASSWADCVERIRKETDRRDILVNNAGVMQVKPFLETSVEEYRKHHAINLEGAWHGMQACYSLLASGAQQTEGSSVINISSIYGQLGGRGVAAYCATKGALRLLTKAVAVEFAEMGPRIRVNSIHPGPVNTDLLHGAIETAVRSGQLETIDQALNITKSMHPMGRLADASDIADATLFLASDSSKFMTGSEVTVDGGYSIT